MELKCNNGKKCKNWIGETRWFRFSHITISCYYCVDVLTKFLLPLGIHWIIEEKLILICMYRVLRLLNSLIMFLLLYKVKYIDWFKCLLSSMHFVTHQITSAWPIWDRFMTFNSHSSAHHDNLLHSQCISPSLSLSLTLSLTLPHSLFIFL